MIQFENVSKYYKDSKTFALREVNFLIERGEFVFLIGSSGAGKSTVIKMLLKEETPTDGNVVVHDTVVNQISRRRLPYLRRNLGIVFQDFRLLDNKTIYENVAFGMEIVGTKRREIKRRVPSVLDMVGLRDRASTYPQHLSGGELQRVGIARAMVNNPKILIADEPTGNLDPQTGKEVMQFLENINRRGTTVLVATHAQYLVDTMKKRVIELDAGKIVRDDQRGYYE